MPVTVGGVVIKPGDAIYANSDGIAVLEESEIDEIVEILRGKEGGEPAMKERIAAGEFLSEASGAARYFE